MCKVDARGWAWQVLKQRCPPSLWVTPLYCTQGFKCRALAVIILHPTARLAIIQDVPDTEIVTNVYSRHAHNQATHLYQIRVSRPHMTFSLPRWPIWFSDTHLNLLVLRNTTIACCSYAIKKKDELERVAKANR